MSGNMGEDCRHDFGVSDVWPKPGIDTAVTRDLVLGAA